jgi:BMFP domain-containing protein YqiC
VDQRAAVEKKITELEKRINELEARQNREDFL